MRECAMSGAGDADNRPGASDFPLELFGRQVLDGQPLHLGEEMVVESKHPGETAGVFELILGGAPLGSQLDCRRVSTDGGGLCGLISLLGRRPVPGE